MLGVDPQLGTAGMPYAYATDNPVNGSDPSGLCTVTINGQPHDFPGLGPAGNCGAVLRDRLEKEGRLPSANGALVAAGVDASLSGLVQDTTNSAEGVQVRFFGKSVARVVPELAPGQTTSSAGIAAAQAEAQAVASGAPDVAGAAGTEVASCGATTLGDISLGIFGTIGVAAAVSVVVVLVAGVVYVVAITNPGHAQPQTANAPVPVPAPTPGTTTDEGDNKPKAILFHYTDATGAAAIVASEVMLASTIRANFGPGQYFTDLPPTGLLTQKEYSNALFRSSNVQQKVTNWLAINVSGLNVQRVSDIYKNKIAATRRPAVAAYGIWLHPSTEPLSVAGRIVEPGTTVFASP